MIWDWVFLVGSTTFLAVLVVVANRALNEAFDILEDERRKK
jgi:hypothetical protein